MRIAGLSKFQRRHTAGMFDNLPPERIGIAMMWLDRFRRKWGKDLPQWRLAILIGQAKRLALNPPNSQWGRSMLAKRGGHAVQQKYWERGQRPTEKATWMRLIKQKAAKAKQADELEARETEEAKDKARFLTSPWGLTPPPAVTKAHEPILARTRPNLPPPPSPEARALHKQLDPPGCRCYYCAWPNHVEP